MTRTARVSEVQNDSFVMPKFTPAQMLVLQCLAGGGRLQLRRVMPFPHRPVAVSFLSIGNRKHELEPIPVDERTIEAFVGRGYLKRHPRPIDALWDRLEFETTAAIAPVLERLVERREIPLPAPAADVAPATPPAPTPRATRKKGRDA